MKRRSLLFTLVLGLFIVLAPSAYADDWFTTGSSVRTKSIGFFSVNVYQIVHQVKGAKPAKSKQAVIDHAGDKRFILTMMRDVPQEKIRKALIDAFGMNGHGGDGRIGQFTGVFKDDGPDLAKGARIIITYNAGAKSTHIGVAGGGSASIPGEDFMKAVWKIWFGKIDQASMGDQLISHL